MSSSPDTAVAARDSHDGSGFAGTSTNDISIAGEATTRAEFDTFAAAEYEQDLPQQAPDLNDDLELSTEESVPPADCKILPLLELYPNMEQDHICKPSVERAIRCIAPRWAKYCGTINQQR
ncbi:expressed unknown protein [Seminavis robusta]|uniref:Uncharacterized protein n=1 Tax=Seminavis robusta TaxID=568900 RepID=A0A9N8E3E2_9STRA|nr:expressed unknown protein [Seminavis robusta]|eukprot:Sro577_g169750.1 n/a (121) ;mRNA; f:56223-56585